MRLECKECHRVLNLPDGKLPPAGRSFTFTCPYCQRKNTALIPGPEAAPARPAAARRAAAAPPPPEPLRPAPGPEHPPLPAISEEADLQSAFNEAVDHRPRAIAVFDDPEMQEFLVRKLEESGYKATAALNLRDAAKQLKFVNCSLLVLQENYCGASLHGNLLLRSIQSIDISSRRGMLVILISPGMTTLDDLTAFGLSIDGIINIADIESIDRLLASITARAKKFYAVYREVLAEHGLG
jgi:CheY-like chemotaxis protein